MASRASLNKVLLIGNLTRDPELRYTPAGNAVCSFGLATNRSWVPSAGGEKREETEFHRIVSWNKLAELCSQLLAKGRKVFVEGRLQTRNWQTPDGQPRQVTEVVISDMRILDSKRPIEELEGIEELDKHISADEAIPAEDTGKTEEPVLEEVKSDDKEEEITEVKEEKGKKSAKKPKGTKDKPEENLAEDDILEDLPF